MEIPYPAILAVYNQASSWTPIMINHHDNDDVTMKDYMKYATNFVPQVSPHRGKGVQSSRQ